MIVRNAGREKPSRSDPVPQPTTAGAAVADSKALLKPLARPRSSACCPFYGG